jgi:GNAT superfamily N-acetyltransferase
MDAQIREYRPADARAVADLSLRAWAPVFTSLERILGPDLFARLHGDWRSYQEAAVRGELADGAVHAWVAETGLEVIGFVTAALRDPQRGLGEIGMLAVDPDAQDRGVGTALTGFAADWLLGSGMRVAMVETGGDPGHAPARRVYQKAGYTLLPVARYFKAL